MRAAALCAVLCGRGSGIRWARGFSVGLRAAFE
jgi:hypothetical protein